MKKIISSFTLFLATIIGFAQAPANYYNNATGIGYTLKTQLKTIITNNHSPLTYTPGLWNLYSSNATNNGFKDKYYENDNTILDIYTEKPSGADTYNFTAITDQCGNYSNEGDCYNREHLIPQSYFDEQTPMKTDAFHVWPTDGKINGIRGNEPFATVGNVNPNSVNVSSNGSKFGQSNLQGYSGNAFEPIDEFKGDIARAFFYFATRYEDFMDDFYEDNPNVGTRVMFDGSTNKVFADNFLNMLYEWHLNDPVSLREQNLNNHIYANQGNRNPFIDNPEYVTLIWQNVLSNETFNSVNFNIYPNPATEGKIYIQTSENINMILVHSIEGKLIQQITKPLFENNQFEVSHLSSGFYIITLKAENNKSTTKKLIVK